MIIFTNKILGYDLMVLRGMVYCPDFLDLFDLAKKIQSEKRE